MSEEKSRGVWDDPLEGEARDRAERHASIPYAVAAKLAGRDGDRQEYAIHAVAKFLYYCRVYDASNEPEKEGPYLVHWTMIATQQIQQRKHRQRVRTLPTISLNAPLPSGNGTIASRIAAPPEVRPEVRPEEASRPYEILAESLRRLRGRHRAVIALRYGEGLRQREVAARMGLCKTRVRQIEIEALESLRRRRRALEGEQQACPLRARKVRGGKAVEAKRKRRASAAATARAEARLAMGLVTSRRCWVAQPETRTLAGPYDTIDEAWADIPPVPEIDSATRRQSLFTRKANGLPYAVGYVTARRMVEKGWKAMQKEIHNEQQ